MSRQRNTTPTYRFHKPSGNAYTDFYDPLTGKKRSVCLGPWQSVESKKEHARIVAECASGAFRRPSVGVSLNEVLLAFWSHAQKHYVRWDGATTSEVKEYRAIIKLLREHHGSHPANEFGVLQLKTVVHSMIENGWQRKTINNRIRRTKHIFKWAASEGIIPASTFHSLQVVSGLQRGRSAAPEGTRRTAVPEEHVRAVLPFVRPSVAAMLELQLLTGMRPGEVCQLRPCDIVQTGAVWKFSPPHHKTLHHDKVRVIMLGPKAQAVLLRFWPQAPDGSFFNPRKEVEQLHADRSERRVTPLYPSHMRRNTSKRVAVPHRVPRNCYDSAAYGKAVARGIEKLNERRGRYPSELFVGPPEPPLPVFTPHQIRHSHAAKIREVFGDLERVRAVLGHSAAGMSDHYSRSADEKLASEVAAAIG